MSGFYRLQEYIDVISDDVNGLKKCLGLNDDFTNLDRCFLTLHLERFLKEVLRGFQPKIERI